MIRISTLRSGGLVLTLLGCLAAIPGTCETKESAAVQQLGKMPLGFQPNRGQAPGNVDFLATGIAANVYLERGAMTLVLPGPDRRATTMHLAFAGGSSSARPESLARIPNMSHSYFVGGDRSKWIQGVPLFAQVRYHDVWPGIDVLFYGNGRQLEYDLIVAPGADASVIGLKISGEGKLSLEKNGDLRFATPAGAVVQQAPDIYQEIAGKRVKVAGRALIARNGMVRFQIGAYDRSQPLVVDPIIFYSDVRLPLTALGRGIAVDSFTGTAYVVGQSVPQQQSGGGLISQGFLYTIDPTGGVHGFTFGGTNGDTICNAVTLDSSLNVYIAGNTMASNLTAAGFQPTFGDGNVPNGNTDAFMVKFSKPDQNGISSPLYSTYIGGAGNDVGNAIAVDANGKAYVGGSTAAANFPRTTGPQFQSIGGTNAFVVKIDPLFPNPNDQRSLVYSTLAGGTGSDTGNGLAVDSQNNVHLTGSTTSTSNTFLPTTATGFNLVKSNANQDGYLLKLNNTGSAAVWLTFVTGGPANAVAGDVSGNTYITGQTNGGLQTNSTNLGFQTTAQGGTDAYVQRYNTAVNGAGSFVYSTYLGGILNDAGYAIAADLVQTAIVVGQTSSNNFPSTSTAFLANPAVLPDAFIARINTNVSGAGSLKFSGRLGGDGNDDARGMAVDPINNVFMTGTTSSSNFPTGTGQTGTGAYAIKLTPFCASKPGIFRQGFLWVLDANGNHAIDDGPSPGPNVFGFGGLAGDIPIYGDWNGDGRTKVGFVRNGNQFFLDYNGNHTFDGPVNDRVYTFGGLPGDIPVVGDWTGDGKTKIGIFRGGVWILDLNGNGVEDSSDDAAAFGFGGFSGDVPVVGDWLGTGKSNVGVFRQGFLWVLDTLGNHTNGAVFAFGGFQGPPADKPIVGDWAGTGSTQVGIFRQGFLWVLDANGNHVIDENNTFIFPFGGFQGPPPDIPVAGCW